MQVQIQDRNCVRYPEVMLVVFAHLIGIQVLKFHARNSQQMDLLNVRHSKTTALHKEKMLYDSVRYSPFPMRMIFQNAFRSAKKQQTMCITGVCFCISQISRNFPEATI